MTDHRALLVQAKQIAARLLGILDVLEADLGIGDDDG